MRTASSENRLGWRPSGLFLQAVGAVILLATVPRARADDPRPEPGFIAPASASTAHLDTDYGPGRIYDRYLTEPDRQMQEEGKEKQEPVFTDSIPVRFDGILCHGLSVFSLLFSMMP
jgi:hypothetical protein